MLDQISRAVKQLSRAERRVAECLLADPKRFVYTPIAGIAVQAGVSQPTVIRFCRSLGYGGLPEFKLALSASQGSRGMPFVHDQLGIGDDAETVIDKVLSNAAAALLGCRRSLDAGALEQAVRLMAVARRIEIYGVGNSGIVAQDAQHKLFRYGISTVAYADNHIQLMAASVLDARDVLLAVSNSGTTIELLDAVAVAKANGAPVVALTRSGTPLAEAADVLLAVSPAEDPALYSPMVSRLMQLVVVDMLGVALGLYLGESASLNLEKGKTTVRSHHRG